MRRFKNVLQAETFNFSSYRVDATSSTIIFTYRVEFTSGKVRTYTDRLFFENIPAEAWGRVPKKVLESTLQALLIMVGINYWLVFRTKNIRIEGFSLTKDQARFWNSLYLNGLSEFFYSNKINFEDLISFPYDPAANPAKPDSFNPPKRALLLNGAGKDSILSAEMLKAAGTPFDFFAFAPTPAHIRVATLVGAKTITVRRRTDWRLGFASVFLGLSTSYPSVSTFTFVATLLAQLLGYNSIIFSNERSADFGNLTYRGLLVNHQWCKSTEAEKMINDYIQRFITPDISTLSLLRQYSELEITRRFVGYPQYLRTFTSCNSYFWLPRIKQRLMRKNYWCKECPKCMFMFACLSAFLPKKEMISIFGANLYAKKRLLPFVRRTLGIEGFKPLDCVGEPEEMIVAMHYASLRKEYAQDAAMQIFNEHFPSTYNFANLKEKVFDA